MASGNHVRGDPAFAGEYSHVRKGEPVMRILVVEDDTASSFILTTLLRQYGETVAAADGKAGLDAFRLAHIEGKPFDLICLDIMMPLLDGQGVLRAIRAFEEEKSLDRKKAARVIMTTALGDKDNVIEALPRCDAYLQKPIDRKELLFYIKKFGLLSPAEQQEIAERERKRAATAKLPDKTKDMPWVD
jgi:two-component system chemotaxis response regulator CheY